MLATPDQAHVATAMTQQAVQGGAQATGRPVGGLAVGQQADFVELDARHVALAGLTATDMLSAHVFACHRTSAVQHVWVGGQPVVHNGRHALHEQAAQAFVTARHTLVAGN